LVYPTPRAFRAVAKGFNMHGEPITVEGTELLARALQHETDHLNGILFIDRLSDADRKLAMKEIRDSDWFGLAASSGAIPQIKVSPHGPFGQGL
jgi:peptide deformylase